MLDAHLYRRKLPHDRILPHRQGIFDLNAFSSCDADSVRGSYETQLPPISPARSSMEPPCGAMSKIRWYVVQTHRQAEMWATQNLARAGYDPYCPTIEEYRRDPVVKTMSRIVAAPMWPGYILVPFDRDGQSWYPITKAEGVRCILGVSPLRPTPISTAFVDAIIAAADERRIIRALPEPFAIGSELTITEGPFADQKGVCLWSSATRVKVMMSVFGGQVEATLDRKAVRV